MSKQAKVILIVLVLVLIAGVLVSRSHEKKGMDRDNSQTAMNSGDTTGTAQASDDTTTTPPSSTGVDVGVSIGTNVKSFTIDGDNFKFVPNTMTVNKGDTVKITFKNTGGMHDLKIDEFNVATPRIQGGQEASVTFVADKTGSFQYYCSVGTHRQMGMWGTLTVK